MVVKIKKLNDKAVTPYKTHKEDMCYDVVATSCEEVAPNVYKYGTGLAFQIKGKPLTTHDVTVGIDWRPRSSIWKTGMVLSNSVGTVDELYRGEVFAVFYHVMPNMPKYEVGDRIGQILYNATYTLSFKEAEELDDTARGDGAYGSTGR